MKTFPARDLLLGLLLAATSNCLWAAWSELSVSADGKVTFYADSDTIRVQGNAVKVLTMVDYQDAQAISASLSFLSIKMEEELDCAGQRSRHLNLAAWSERKGEGKVVGLEKNPAPWRQATSDGQVEAILRFACMAR